MNFDNREFSRFNRHNETHVHELLGSTYLAERGNERHNHRFASVSGPAIPSFDSHVHDVFTRTDSTDDHFHIIRITTSPAVDVGDGRHIHTACGVTSREDEHIHEFYFVTLAEGDN